MPSLSKRKFTYNTMLQIIFSVIVMLIGIITLLLSFKIHNQLIDNLKNCKNKNIHNSNAVIMILSTITISISVSYLLYIAKCDCKPTNEFHSKINLSLLFPVILILLGIPILINGSIINSNSGNCGLESTAKSIWGLGLFLILLGVLFLIYKLVMKKLKKD